MKRKAINPKSLLALEKYPVRMSAQDVAAYLNVSDNHVRELCRTGRLPAVNVAASGKQAIYRVWRDDVAKFEAKNKL